MKKTNRFQFEKPKEENKPVTKEAKKRSRISPPRRKIYSFGDLRILEDCGSIDLTKKSVETFVGLPNLKYLTRLNLDSNPLRSFEGSPKLPNLRWLSARNSPISRNPYFKLMAVIVFGNNITTINNEKVPQIHKQATAFRDSLYPELLKGRIIANLRPLRFIDTKNDIVVNADPSILTATKKIIYKAPAVQEFERTVVERSKEQFRIPSVATICDGIIEREDEENNNYFPDKFMDNFLSQLHDLRVKYNAKYENSSSDYDNSEEEAINESTQSQESINDASPIKPPQADNIAKHLIQSESDSEIKINQSNIDEEMNKNTSNHSKKQDILIEEEEEQNDIHDQIESENIHKEEEEENENKEEEEINIKKDTLEINEEEEEENQKIQTLENIPNEEEEKSETEKENDDIDNSDLKNQHKDSNDDKLNEEENENEINNSSNIEHSNIEDAEESKDGNNNSSINADNDTLNEEEEKTEIQNRLDKEEEEEKTEVQSISNITEEEEKNENNQSPDELDQNQEDQNENLSENSSAKSDE